jgi:hypothetical protein
VRRERLGDPQRDALRAPERKRLCVVPIIPPHAGLTIDHVGVRRGVGWRRRPERLPLAEGRVRVSGVVGALKTFCVGPANVREPTSGVNVTSAAMKFEVVMTDAKSHA